jgi:arsenate reductase
MTTIYGYNGCSTVKKAIKFLKDNNVDYKHIDNVVNKLSVDDLKEIHFKTNDDLKKLFNTSGVLYRELDLKNKYDTMTDDEKFILLASDGKLVKRPILVTDTTVLIGFKINEWEALLKDKN